MNPSPPKAGSLRRRIHFILEVDHFGDRLSALVDRALIVLIVANVLAAILETVDSYKSAAPWAFEWFEALSMGIFGLEYILRVWSCVEEEEFDASSPIMSRLRFALGPMMLIDLAVLVLPLKFDLRPLRVLRLLRLGRYSPRLRLFGEVIRNRRGELGVGLLIALVLLVASSTAMYHVERSAGGTAFQSIPQTMWWGVATLTTVGYGDVYPTTDLGKALGSVVALLGVGVFALPAGILASGFAEALTREIPEGGPKGGSGGGKDRPNAQSEGQSGSGQGEGTCPHCGASTPQ